MTKETTVDQFLQEQAYQFFTNEDVNKFAFHALPAKEKHQICAHLALVEFTNFSGNPETVQDAVKTIDQADTASKDKFQASTSLSTAYFNRIIASKGDVKRTPNYTSNRSLISYSRSVCQSSAPTQGSKAFLKKVSELEMCLDNLEKYASSFEKIMDHESKTYSDEKQRILTQFYTNLVVAIDVGVDVLYSSSIRAKVDYSRRPALVSNVYFECKDDFMAEHLTLVHYFNSLAISGKLRGILDKGTVETLVVARDRVLREENVLDAVFAMVSSNRWADLLLMPIYMIRSVVYTVKYLSASYQKLTFSIGQSIAMIRKQSVTEDEFKTYKKEADFKAAQFEQASRKAALDVSSSSKRDVEKIDTLASPKTSAAQGSTLI